MKRMLRHAMLSAACAVILLPALADGPVPQFDLSDDSAGGSSIGCNSTTGHCKTRLNGQPSCSDNNACTRDTYDPASGTCRYTPVSCSDHSDRTIDLCEPARGCLHLIINPAPGGNTSKTGLAPEPEDE